MYQCQESGGNVEEEEEEKRRTQTFMTLEATFDETAAFFKLSPPFATSPRCSILLP